MGIESSRQRIEIERDPQNEEAILKWGHKKTLLDIAKAPPVGSLLSGLFQSETGILLCAGLLGVGEKRQIIKTGLEKKQEDIAYALDFLNKHRGQFSTNQMLEIILYYGAKNGMPELTPNNNGRIFSNSYVPAWYLEGLIKTLEEHEGKLLYNTKDSGTAKAIIRARLLQKALSQPGTIPTAEFIRIFPRYEVVQEAPAAITSDAPVDAPVDAPEIVPSFKHLPNIRADAERMELLRRIERDIERAVNMPVTEEVRAHSPLATSSTSVQPS